MVGRGRRRHRRRAAAAAQPAAFPFVDLNGWHFRNYDGGRLYEDGTRVMTLNQKVGEAATRAFDAAIRADIIRGRLRENGVMMTVDEVLRHTGDFVDACRFRPDAESDKTLIRSLADDPKHAKTMQAKALATQSTTIFLQMFRQQLANDQIELPQEFGSYTVVPLRSALAALPTDVGYPYGQAIYNAYLVYDGLKEPSDAGRLLTLGLAHGSAAGYFKANPASDGEKQQWYTMMAAMPAWFKLTYLAVIRKDPQATAEFARVGVPVPALAEAKADARTFIQLYWTIDPHKFVLTDAGLFVKGRPLT